jgi:hypothetical protein
MTVAPAQALWNMQNPDARISVGVTMLTTPEVLETLFPELGGKMPLSMQDHWWGTILSLNALRLPPYTTPEATVPPFVFGFTDAEVRELIPSENQRKAVFSIRFLVSLQREYTRRLLAAAGATDVFAGVSYGQDPLEPPVGAEDMRELIVAASDVPNPVTKQGTPSANVKKQLDTVRQARIRSAGAVSPEIKRFQRMDNTELALAAQKSMLAAGILRTREKALQDSLDDAIEPNYTPLVAGTAAVVAALFLRRRLN